ncbi:MAG TPA: polysaccharide deacetylase family protein [Pseudonocardia sp.]|jgi:peptidoglycan/xylan/chitin deacetylase (PgdA/CDA1 family)|uniref:polysaccharide deacetylase family protein n=1 Tax=Pseudonocardia sp. TaxID=60912 RepID=UPI002B4B7BC7|nr:polysaccharide deacetylase family protein [Pseudonocardia sp.]HLU59337.1 polysaccharide deacetylase family protein [Pseudonocardia sp.]
MAPRSSTVLMLHDVLPDDRPLDQSGFTGPGPDRYKIRRRLFEAMAERARATGTVLTFDDGGRSALDVVAPVLAEHGLRGEFFIATARLGTPGFLDRAGVAELAAAGHVVGSHSHTHPELMTRLSEEEILDEWRTSVEVLEDVTGKPVDHASVPNGFTNRAVLAAAYRAGIRTLYTSTPTRRRRTYATMDVVGRFAVLAVDAPGACVALASGAPAPRLKQQARWNALAVSKRLLGPRYPAVRSKVLGMIGGRSA